MSINKKLNPEYSQVFLKNDIICEKLTSYLKTDENSLIIEIGPGGGSITKYVLDLPCKKIELVELDKKWANFIKQEYKDIRGLQDKLRVINEDILKYKLAENEEQVFIVGNIPFNITYPIFQRFIEWKSNVKEIAIIVQDEVAKKTFKVGGKGYGPLTVLMQLYFDVELKDFIEPKNFFPMPAVNCRIIKFIRKKQIFTFNKNVETEFRKFLEIAFKHPRKNIKNNFSGTHLSNLEVIKKIEEKRAQEFTPQELIEIWAQTKC